MRYSVCNFRDVTETMPIKKQVYLVDDDAAICDALSMFLESCGYQVETFSSAEDFLAAADAAINGVMLLDQRMTGMTGLELQAELDKRAIGLQIIFISGHADVRMSVQAIKAGAINLLEKPFTNEELLRSLTEAFSLVIEKQLQHERFDQLRQSFCSLTEREKEVIEHVVAGHSNRQLAERMGVSDRTIEVHRARGMKKMGATSLPDLVRKYAQCQQIGIT